MKRTEEMRLRAALIRVIEDWWEKEDIGAPRLVLGDSTLVHMAESALAVLLSVDDLYETLHADGELKEEG